MPYTDSHAHLSGADTYSQADSIISRALKADVTSIVNICTDVASLERGLELKNRYPSVISCCAATHPHDVAEKGEAEFAIMAAQAHKGALVGVGETGLDTFYDHSPLETQELFLKRYLALAKDCGLPVVIHCRQAFDWLFHILDNHFIGDTGSHCLGVLHCFTGSQKEAEEVLSRGWYISLSGIVTFKKSEALRDIAAQVPLNRLLIETDTPFLAPQSQRGTPNEPAFLPEIARCVATIKGIAVEELAAMTTANAKALFSLGD